MFQPCWDPAMSTRTSLPNPITDRLMTVELVGPHPMMHDGGLVCLPNHLIGRAPNLGTFQAAAHEARKAVDPLDDPSVPAEYRRGVVRAMVARALEGATA